MASTTAKKTIGLSTPLQFFKGVGPMRASLLARKGIVTIQDALYYFPRRYEDRRSLSQPQDLRGFSDGMQVTVLAQIQSVREIPLRGRKQSMLELVAMGEKGDLLACTWFRSFPGQKEKYKLGSWAIFTGALRMYRGSPQLTHPDIELLKEKPDKNIDLFGRSLHWGRITPLYSKSEKITQKFLREIIHLCLEEGLPHLHDLLPQSLRDKYQLPEIKSALEAMHFPRDAIPAREVLSTEELHPAIRRLIFEEFFKFQLVLLMDRASMKVEVGIPMRIKGHAAQRMRKNLPYTLTNAQERALVDSLGDLQKEIAMNRIVQGDVGSGKTLVAFLTLAEVAENGFQSALLAPTEILAEQHYQNAQKVFAGTGIEVGFLSGSLSKAEKDKTYEKIRTGGLHIVIGTHAIIQESVQWKNLAAVVIDEQHRFGVKQRTYLKDKAPSGKFPHILTMTATPIPRSLALTIFGELAVSSIDELPPGRQSIPTKILRGSERQKLYNLIHKEVGAGRQAYIVYSLVTDSDKEGMEKLKSAEAEFERLRENELHGLRLAVVHGQMKAEERNAIMHDFKQHKYDVLISTTVIEVGVDVPNATVMAIENAERFGLSQLHQLRGRVGRGAHKSYCVLITESAPPGAIKPQGSAEDGVEDESPWVRLGILEKTQNGFEIAELDLKLRGPGDFFGTKQSGSPSFQLADLSRDASLLELARQEAQAIFARDPALAAPENAGLKAYFHSVLEEAADTLKSG